MKPIDRSEIPMENPSKTIGGQKKITKTLKTGAWHPFVWGLNMTSSNQTTFQKASETPQKNSTPNKYVDVYTVSVDIRYKNI